MIRLIKTELWKLKRYSVLWIGVAAMLSTVLLTRFMAFAEVGTIYTLEKFSNSVIWNNFTLIYPATITLITGYIIERERTDDTLKNLLTIPFTFPRLLLGKIVTSCLIAVFLAVMEFVFMLIIFFISDFPDFSGINAIKAMVQMIGMNLFVYIAVLPIILITSQWAGTYMSGVAFAFFYGFVAAFASGHGLTSLYPISAGLTLIGYQEGGIVGDTSKGVSLAVLICISIISGILIVFSENRVKKTKNKK